MDMIVKDDEIAEVFAPFVQERLEPDDPKWEGIVVEAAKRQRGLRLRRQMLGWLGLFRRTQRSIESNYSHQWASTPLETQLRSAKPSAFEWRGKGLLAYAPGRKKLHQRLLIRAIDRLRPQTALEVGCGNGLNLFLLAARFPQIQFSGIELTRGGVEAAGKICALPEIPEVIKDFAVEPLRDLKAHRRVGIQRANAAALPYDSKSVDLVFTVLALEQMEEVRNRVLAEISRVAKRYVVMIEPFRDWNAEGIRRDYIVSQDYFSAWIADLKPFGLQPVFSFSDIPNKLTFAVGLVIAEVL